MFSSKSFVVSGLIFRSLIHFEFMFVYSVRGASLVAQSVKNLPAVQETWVRSLGWEDPLEKGTTPTPVFWPENSMNCMYTHFQIPINKAMFITQVMNKNKCL